MQEADNDSGGAPSLIFRAGLGLGCALLEGGNLHVQRDIYESLAAGSHSSVLANLAAALVGEGARLTNYDKEVRQRKWYLQVMHQTEADP